MAGSSYDSLHHLRSSSEERGGKPRCRYPPWLRVLAASFNPIALLQERENEQRSPGVSAKAGQGKAGEGKARQGKARQGRAGAG